MEARYTPWHYLLAEVMQYLIDDSHLEIHPFEKLGTLPLEADIILLRKKVDEDLAALHPELDFLMRHLGRYTVVEYKSPKDRLTHEDLDTVRAYAMLCKRKFELAKDSDVRIAMLYSHKEKGFFEQSKKNGLAFQDAEPGIKRCDIGRLTLLAMDLAELGKQRPASFINLFSSRSEKFISSAETDKALLGAIRYLQENIEKRGDMKHADLRNSPEFTQDMDEIRRRLLRRYTAEERLKGLSPKERLEGLSPEQLIEELSPEKLDKLQKLLASKT